MNTFSPDPLPGLRAPHLLLPPQPLPLLGENLSLFDPLSRSFALTGRKAELDALERWVHGNALVSVRVISGEGGIGKTRLALELADRLRAYGWEAGFFEATALDAFVSQPGLEQWRWFRPMLIVVDQAAGQAEPLARWLPLLARRQAQAEQPLRLLLLERHASTRQGWWPQAFAEEASRNLLAPATPVVLRPLGDEARRGILNATLASLDSPERVPPTPGDEAQFDHPLDTLRWAGNPLYLMMAAGRVRAVDLRHLFPKARSELVIPMARAELARLKQLARERQIPEEIVCHMAALVTLWGGASSADVGAALTAELATLRWAYDGALDVLVQTLAEAMPGPELGRIAPIQPAAVGASFILGMLSRRPYAENVILRAWQHKGWPVVENLIRAVMDCGNNPDKPPLRWLQTLAQHMSLAARWRLLCLLPAQHDALDDFALTQIRALASALDPHPATPEAQAFTAAVLDHLARREDQAGQYRSAFDARQASLGWWRNADKHQNGRWSHELALGLAHASILAGTHDDRQASIQLARESLELRQQLASQFPAAQGPELAMAWNNQANALSEAGQPSAALTPQHTAVEQFRQLEAAYPEVFTSELAMSLNNLGLLLEEERPAAEAQGLFEEAVRIQRRLCRGQSDRELGNLALFLNNLATHHAGQKRTGEALRLALEVVSLRRTLHARKPDLHRPGLAMALSNLGLRHQDMGDFTQALAVTQEAVRLWEVQIRIYPEGSYSQFGYTLMTLGRCQQSLKALPPALASYRQAIECLLTPARRNPGTYTPWLQQAAKHYIQCCEALQTAPEEALIESVVALVEG
ncbi:MAG: tetratricopeptide repeat protein [Rhodocyclales bacterium]|nr:tetratricopeptide repeat protein [Rhodocyclales bacterium]